MNASPTTDDGVRRRRNDATDDAWFSSTTGGSALTNMPISVTLAKLHRNVLCHVRHGSKRSTVFPPSWLLIRRLHFISSVRCCDAALPRQRSLAAACGEFVHAVQYVTLFQDPDYESDCVLLFISFSCGHFASGIALEIGVGSRRSDDDTDADLCRERVGRPAKLALPLRTPSKYGIFDWQHIANTNNIIYEQSSSQH